MKFACPKCGQHIETDDDMAGMDAACPTCSAPIKVPPVSSDELKGEPRPNVLVPPPLPHRQPDNHTPPPLQRQIEVVGQSTYASMDAGMHSILNLSDSILNTKTVLQEEPSPICLEVSFAGMWLVWEPQTAVLVDGTKIGTGSFKKGFTFRTPLEIGNHCVQVQAPIGFWQKFDVCLDVSGNYSVELRWGKLAGAFKEAVVTFQGQGSELKAHAPQKAITVSANKSTKRGGEIIGTLKRLLGIRVCDLCGERYISEEEAFQCAMEAMYSGQGDPIRNMAMAQVSSRTAKKCPQCGAVVCKSCESILGGCPLCKTNISSQGVSQVALRQKQAVAAGRLVCPLCGGVYNVGDDACIMSLGNVFAFMAGQGTAVIGNATGMAASTPDLVARIKSKWDKDERELKLRDTQTNMNRVRSMLKAGQQPRWECYACREKNHPNPYPKDF